MSIVVSEYFVGMTLNRSDTSSYIKIKLSETGSCLRGAKTTTSTSTRIHFILYFLLLQIIKINEAYTQAASLNRCVREKMEFRVHNLGDSP